MTTRQLPRETCAARGHTAGARAGLSRCKLLALVLALCLLGGCSILEVIDGIGGGDVAAEDQEDDSCEHGASGEACGSGSGGLGNWWANAKTLSSDEMETDIVRCRIGDASRFTNRQSCLARGGTPAD